MSGGYGRNEPLAPGYVLRRRYRISCIFDGPDGFARYSPPPSACIGQRSAWAQWKSRGSASGRKSFTIVHILRMRASACGASSPISTPLQLFTRLARSSPVVLLFVRGSRWGRQQTNGVASQMSGFCSIFALDVLLGPDTGALFRNVGSHSQSSETCDDFVVVDVGLFAAGCLGGEPGAGDIRAAVLATAG